MRKPLALAVTAPLLVAPLIVGAPAQAESVVKMPKVKKNIKQGFKKQADLSVTVKCPKKMKWAKGKTFFCKVRTKAGQKVRVQVKLGSAVTGRVTWKVVS